jgi:hypothetical protein
MVYGKRVITVILGIFTAVILVVSQVFFFTGTEFNKKEQKTEKHSEESSSRQDVPFIVASSAPASSIQTQIHQEITFLFEILLAEDEQRSWTTDIPLSLGKYFQTLFHIIISPNAP